MSRRPARCTEADLKRAVKAVLAAGARATIRVDPDGTIQIDAVPVPKLVGANSPKRRIAL